MSIMNIIDQHYKLQGKGVSKPDQYIIGNNFREKTIQ